MQNVFLYILLVIFIISSITLGSSILSSFRTKERISAEWGQEIEKKYTDDDWTKISEYFNNLVKDKKNRFFIDEITWNDLTMEKIFEKINTTETNVGEQYLYTLLREIIHDEEKLKNRDELIDYFSTHKIEREKVQYILSKLGRAKGINISDYFLNLKEIDNSSINWYTILGFIPLLSLVILYFNKTLGLIVLLVSLLENLLIYYTRKSEISHHLDSFIYIVNIVKCGDLILKQKLDILSPYNKELKDALNKVKKIKAKSPLLNNASTDIGIIIEYINALTLISIANYKSLSVMLVKNSREFNKIFEIVGVIDSCIAIASYRERLDYYVKPKLTKEKNKSSIIIEGLGHPFIEKCVTNSINIKDSILVTGSNASGKSTFLKSVALNAILAQTIYTCFAKEFSMPHMNIFTSMALKDNLFNNESYYIAETKSLKRIIDSVSSDTPTMCFVDEILRGTNSVERIASSTEVLKYLTLNNCLCIAATHDIELTHILENHFKNYHFREEIVDNQIFFDYKIHEGRATTQNAIKLLGILGYDNSIVESASNRAANFVREGTWSKC